MNFHTLFPPTPDGIRQLKVLNACVAAAGEQFDGWQKLTKGNVTSLTDERIRFNIDQVYAKSMTLGQGLTISEVIWSLRELQTDFGLLRNASGIFEDLRLTPNLLIIHATDTLATAHEV